VKSQQTATCGDPCAQSTNLFRGKIDSLPAAVVGAVAETRIDNDAACFLVIELQ
jgi:hypothetical protein